MLQRLAASLVVLQPVLVLLKLGDCGRDGKVRSCTTPDHATNLRPSLRLVSGCRPEVTVAVTVIVS